MSLASENTRMRIVGALCCALLIAAPLPCAWADETVDGAADTENVESADSSGKLPELGESADQDLLSAGDSADDAGDEPSTLMTEDLSEDVSAAHGQDP